MANALVLDFDGTLMDTEPLHDAALLEILTCAGVHATKEELLKTSGVGIKGTMEHYEKLNKGKKIDWKQLTKEFYDSLLPSTLKAKPFEGVPQAVKELAERFPLAIASNNHEPVIRAGLKKNNLEQYFQTIIAWEDCVKRKPEPEPYLRACKALGFAPQQCAAVEDSPTGLQSALSAGCRVIAFTSRNPPQKELQVAYSTNSFYDITPELVAKL